jgi:hypothetical protein
MKKFKILFASLLLFVGGQAMAQSGSTPFVNSTHTYTVNGGTATTDYTYNWEVLSGGVATTDATLGTNGAASIDITWELAGTYTVQLTETASVADGGCSTVREFEVVVTGNSFDVSIADLAASCSDDSGSVITGETLSTTSKTFTIDMATQSDMTTATFLPDWSFDYDVASTSGELVSVTFDANTSVASETLSGTTASGTATVDSDDYSVELTVVFNNTWASGDMVTVTLSNGLELTYNTPESDDTNNTGSVTINAMPATTDITTD